LWDYSALDAIADLAALPLANASVDVAVCVQVLEHVSQPHTVLAEISRVLRPGGRLFLTTSFTWPQHQKPFDGLRFSSFGLRRLLEEASLDVEWMWPMGGSWTVAHMQLAHALAVTRDSKRRSAAPVKPLAAVASAMVEYAKPVFYALDSLDAERDSTLGYFVCAQRHAA
jgi:SAM-dependent methyltransferase